VKWLRGLDLNQRPLGNEGKSGRDGHQVPPTDSIREAPLQPAWLGWVGARRQAFTDKTPTLDELGAGLAPRLRIRRRPEWPA
jgi:hypothetical protein